MATRRTYLYFSTAPLISLSAISSTQLNITLTAEPAESYSLTYQCNITEIDMPPITVTGTELEYTVVDLNPNVNYTVKCMSSNGEDSCGPSIDMIRRKLLSIVHLNYALYLNNCINEIIQIQYQSINQSIITRLLSYQYVHTC